MTPLLLALVVGLALALAYLNGFHDASNAVSTTISTRALRESTALALAAVLNLLGALLGLLLVTAGAGWALDLLGVGLLAEATTGTPDLLGWALVAMTLATLLWGLLTWWIGMPSSTWHAFLGSALGVALVLGVPGAWPVVLGLLLAATLLGPLLGAAISFGAMRLLLRFGRSERLRIGHLRYAQTVSAGAVATGHGMVDSRLPLAIVALAMGAAGLPATTATLTLVPIAVAVAVGTLAGGHRIIRTIGRRLTPLSSAQGVVAESTAAVLMGVGVAGLGIPISSSHTLASGVVGAGAAIGRRHVRWDVATRMVLVWLLTPAATALTAGFALLLLRDLA